MEPQLKKKSHKKALTLAILIIMATAMTTAIITTTAKAHGYKLGTLSIGHVWAPPSEDGRTAVYGPLYNSGEDDALIAVETPIADTVEFIDANQDDAENTGGVPTGLDQIKIPAGTPVSLAAWDAHIAIYGLKKPLKNGDSFPLILTFAKEGKITVTVEVEAEPMSSHDKSHNDKSHNTDHGGE